MFKYGTHLPIVVTFMHKPSPFTLQVCFKTCDALTTEAFSYNFSVTLFTSGHTVNIG
jgi:hypothetical protein